MPRWHLVRLCSSDPSTSQIASLLIDVPRLGRTLRHDHASRHDSYPIDIPHLLAPGDIPSPCYPFPYRRVRSTLGDVPGLIRPPHSPRVHSPRTMTRNLYCDNYATCNEMVVDRGGASETRLAARAKGWHIFDGLTQGGVEHHAVLGPQCVGSRRRSLDPAPPHQPGQRELF